MARLTRKRCLIGLLNVIAVFLFLRNYLSVKTKAPNPEVDFDAANMNRKILESIAINKQLFNNDVVTNQTNPQPKVAVPTPPPRQRVLLISYMRSGSTFTGDLFQFSPDVFYFYEPLLYRADVDIGPGKNSTRLKLDTKSTWTARPPDSLAFVYKMLHCDVSTSDMVHLPGLRLSKSTKEFDCPKTSIKCVLSFKQKCMSKRVRLAKVLRLKMYEVEELLRYDPGLKVIHLVRDPRAVSVSRQEAEYFFNFLTFCERLNADAIDSVEIQKKYPDRVLTVRYEDMANSPVSAAKKLFEFAGITWSDDVERMTLDLTSPANTSFVEFKFDTKRKNSAETASKWRQKIGFDRATVIQHRCRIALQKYGYKQIQTESQLRNMEQSLYLDTYSDEYHKL